MDTMDPKKGHFDTDGVESIHTELPLDKSKAPPRADNGNGSISDSKDLLIKFQTIVGIKTPMAIADPRDTPTPTEHSESTKGYSKLDRPAQNIGIYQRIVKLQKNRHREYLVITALLNACLLAQIIFAAILTALGASEAPHNVITVFGAINVAIAGLLAFYKGQGLPDRLRQDWIGLSKVRDYIEERERLLQANVKHDPDLEKGDIQGGKPDDLMMEIKTVLAMFNQQIDTMEANRPDTYVIPGVGTTTGATTGTTVPLGGTGNSGSHS
jgi:hypothetical protein